MTTTYINNRIKGYQIQEMKGNKILLLLHAQKPDPPKDINLDAWAKWHKTLPTTYRIEMAPGWWRHVWPGIKGNVNICIAKNKPEAVMDTVRVWIRLAEDISISIYSHDVFAHRNDFDSNTPYHPGCLTDHIRVPYDWWSEKIEEVTERVTKLASTY